MPSRLTRAALAAVVAVVLLSGSGTTLGRTFEELATIARLVDSRNTCARIGFCIDTCHALAAGYDITTPAGAERTFQEFDRICGGERLKVLHLNDSKGSLGCRTDRHAHIGEGATGLAVFKFIMNHPDFRDVPKILETPKGETPKGTPWDSLNRRRLLRMVQPEGGVVTRPPRSSAGVR